MDYTHRLLYVPLFLRKLWLSPWELDGRSLDDHRIHTYDVYENELSETRRIPKATRDVFQDLDTDALDEQTYACLETARKSFRRSEQDTETILDRILPLDPSYKRFAMGTKDVDILRRYFVFLRFRNSDHYHEIVKKVSGVTEAQVDHDPHSLIQEQNWRCLGGRVRLRTFLTGVHHFMDGYDSDGAYLGCQDMQRYCWSFCKAQVSFGIAAKGHEYLLTDHCFGTLDEGLVHSLECGKSFFPVTPKVVLYILSDHTNADAPTRGQLLVDCGQELMIDIHLRNAILLQSAPGRISFSSLNSAAQSIASYDEFRWTPDHLDYSRLKLRCRQKFTQETVAKTLVIKGAFILTDLTDEVVRLEDSLVASGSFADVYKGVWKERSGEANQKPRIVALKFLRRTLPAHVRDNFMKRLNDEVVAWYRLQHPHIAQLFGVVQLKDTIGMVSSWCEKGTISNYLAANPSADRLKLLIQVASGCCYLHNYKPVVVHGDLKGGNILIDDNGRAIITDFGLSKVMEELSGSLNRHTSFFAGSARWMAPELMSSLVRDDSRAPPITTSSDVYAFSCVCLEVATGEVPFAHRRFDYAVIADIIRGVKPAEPTRCHINVGAQPAFWAMLDRCWSAEPDQRPSMGDVAGLLCYLHNAYS